MKGKRNRSWVGLSAPRWTGHHVIRNGEGAMMKQFMRALLCLCLLLPLGAKAEIFVFGDSLSDTGNAAAGIDISLGKTIGTIGLCPIEPPLVACEKIFSGTTRVSNGPVAVERLAELLDFGELKPSLFFLPPALRPFVGTNYAVVAASS